MNPQEFAVYALTFAEIVGVPMYMKFRTNMKLHNAKASINYSKKRIIRLLMVNFFLNSIGTLWSIFMFFRLSNMRFFESTEGILFFLMYAGAVLCTYYGNGLYIASVTIEAYLWNSLGNIDSNALKALKHIIGPVSHLIIHTGWLVALLGLASLDGLTNVRENLNWAPLVIAGICVGIGHAASQFYSKTAKYQFITGFLCLIAFFMIFQGMDFSVRKTIYGSFFAGAIITYCLTLALWPLAKRAGKILRFIAQVFDWRE